MTTLTAQGRAQLATGLFLSASAVLFLMLFIAFVTFHEANALPNPGLTINAVLTASILAAAFTVRRMSIASLIAGLVFLGLQIADFRDLTAHNITIAASPFDTAYFTLTGIHALYVLAGLVATGLFLIFKGGDERREAAAGALALYWRFLAGVWVLIFIVVHLGGAS